MDAALMFEIQTFHIAFLVNILTAVGNLAIPHFCFRNQTNVMTFSLLVQRTTEIYDRCKRCFNTFNFFYRTFFAFWFLASKSPERPPASLVNYLLIPEKNILNIGLFKKKLPTLQ